MKKLLFFLIVAASLTACKKNSVDAPVTAGNTNNLIKTWASGANISTYTYDAQGRISKVTISDGSGYEYEYLSGIVNKKEYHAGHILYATYKLELNADGLKIRTTASNSPVYEELYQYNADKTLAKQIGHYDNGAGGIITQVVDYFYSNGNCDSSRFIGNNGLWQTSILRTYYTDKLNGLGKNSFGNNFEGKDNKNLMKSEIYAAPDGTTGTPSNYTYEFDA